LNWRLGGNPDALGLEDKKLLPQPVIGLRYRGHPTTVTEQLLTLMKLEIGNFLFGIATRKWEKKLEKKMSEAAADSLL